MPRPSPRRAAARPRPARPRLRPARGPITLRGLLTYIGAGTQWINAADAPDPAPGRINEVPPFTLAVLKGRLMGDHPAILHRSPPIAGTGRKRLLLVIDPVAGAHPACKEGAPIPG